jgi:sulfoxide reductase catalytic subunit YedY
MRFLRRPWELGENDVTPETLFVERRRLLGGAAGALAAGLIGLPRPAAAVPTIEKLLPAKVNADFPATEQITPEFDATNYNNFYEFGFDKAIQPEASKLKVSPWAIVVDGLVDKPFKIDIDDLLKKVTLEERIYRHRCVETWSAVVPWTGFPLSEIVAMASPKADAKFLQMESFSAPDVARQQRAARYPWPYTEALTIAEAKNDLAFLAVGMYGKPIPNQNGAPIRLAVPWKYGFKAVKSIVRFSFVAKRPRTFWEELGPQEYGFWANINPKVAHPRWSQATERRLGTNETVPTLLYNGYEAQVGGLYKGMEKERIFY